MPSTCQLLEGQEIDMSCDAQSRQRSKEEVELESDMLESDNILEYKLKNWESLMTLTKREKEVLLLVLAGKTNREIAQSLYRTERTVEYHRNRMMRKLGTHTIVDLVKRAIELGIV